MNKISNFLWGLVFVIVGVIIGLNMLEITDINIFFDGWWTLFIIIPCFIELFKDDDKTGDFIGLAIGVLLLLACQDLLDFGLVLRLIFPIILILIGLSFIFRDSINRKIKKEIKYLNKNNKEQHEYTATFGGQNIDFTNEKFTGCNLTAVFGGIKCDLKDADIKDGSLINVSSIFGGVTIYTPKDINIKVVSLPIFGGVTNKNVNSGNNKTTLYINATCIFGGVEIK